MCVCVCEYLAVSLLNVCAMCITNTTVQYYIGNKGNWQASFAHHPSSTALVAVCQGMEDADVMIV